MARTSREAEIISLVYEGGLASSGQLHFYEYGRASYAFARLIATIENFRRTGRVAEKIGRGSYVDIVIKAPRRGSFPVEIIVPIATTVAPALSGLPLKDLLDYVIHLVKRLLPSDETKLLQLAKIRLEEEKERTKRSKEETKRFREFARAVESSNLNTKMAMDLVKYSMASTNRKIARLEISQADMKRMLDELSEADAREKRIAKSQTKLQKIDSKKLAKLTSRVRPQLAETGLPLRRSATSMRLAADRNKKSIASFDSATIIDINSRDLSEEEESVPLRIFAYDKDTGIGKADILGENLKRVHFSIPSDLRARLRRKAITAMQRDEVAAQIRRFRDKSGLTTSMLLVAIQVDP
jgi:uncharacterized coiled-coil protein SlyX